jgi:geranyl-CoA carboxylase alpha subunit
VAWRFPILEGLRVDHGLSSKAEVPRFYDSMIAKLIAHGPTRAVALQRLVSALRNTHVVGIKTNRDYLLACLSAPSFTSAQLHTRWLDFDSTNWKEPPCGPAWVALAGALYLHHAGLAHGSLAHWSNGSSLDAPLRLSVADGDEHLLRIETGASRQSFKVGEHEIEIPLGSGLDTLTKVQINGFSTSVFARMHANTLFLDALGVSASCRNLAVDAPDTSKGQAASHLFAKMHGMVRGLTASAGQTVQLGDRLLSLEAMKMEHSINAPCAGSVKIVHVHDGMQVAPGLLMIELEPSDPK